MRRRPVVRMILVASTAAAAGAIALAGHDPGDASGQSAVRYSRAELFIETNATAGDAGLQLSLDAEDWRQFKLLGPRGDVMAQIDAKGKLRPFGLTELFFEASEPSFEDVPFRQFRRRFPAGVYRFRGVDVDGRRVVGHDRLSHLVPSAPRVTFPTRGARVSPDGFRVTWEPVTRPAGVRVVTYQLIIKQGACELSMYLPRNATGATVPGEFLEPGRGTEGEVLVREAGGNQTITELPAFRTA